MRARRTLTVVGCHAGGEIGDVITGRRAAARGATVFEQMQTLQRDGRLAAARCCCASRAAASPATSTCRARDAPRLRRRVHHHGADRVPADVRLEHDLHHDGAARDRAWWRCASPRPCVRLEAPGGVVEARAALSRRALRERRVHERALLRRPARRAARGRGARHRLGRCRLRRHVVRDRRRAGAGLRDRAGRGARPVGRGRADPRGGTRAALVRAPGESRHLRRQHRADRRALAGRRQGDAQRRRRRARAARPLGDGHRPLGAPRGAARARADAGRRRDVACLGDRLDVRRPDRARGAGRRARRHRAGDPRQRLDHRHLAGTSSTTSDPYPEGYLLSDTWGVSGLDSQP